MKAQLSLAPALKETLPPDFTRGLADALNGLVEQGIASIFSIDTQLRLLSVNPGWMQGMGYRPNEVIGHSLMEFVCEEDRAGVAAIARRVFRGEDAPAIAARLRRRDGETIEVLGKVSLIGRGDDAYVIGVAIDVTERKRAERELEIKNKILQTQQESAPEGILVIDDVGGRIVSVNKRFKDLLQATELDERSSLDDSIEAMARRVADPRAFRDRMATVTANPQETAATEMVMRDDRIFAEHIAPIVADDGAHLGRVVFLNDVTERKRAERELLRSNRMLRTLSGCNLALVRATSEPELLDEVCRVITESGYAFSMIFFAGQDEGKSLALVAHSGIANGLPALFAGVALTWSEDRPFGKGPIGRAIRTGEIAVGRDLRNDPALALFAPFAAKHGLRSKVAVPLKDAAGTLGALVILDAADEFDEGAIPVLRELATDLTFGIRTLRIRNEHGAALHQLEQNMESTVQAIGRAVEFRDPYTSGHQHRVAKLAGAIGQEMELSRDEVRAIRIASLVHDVGKIYVPAEILTKPGDLSKLEFDLIKIHAQAGAEILESIEFPWPVAKTVRQHHERLDGSGYPDSLRGDDILLSARVIAVADVMESMMTHRPYRPAHSVQDALAELGAGRGRLYDARAVDACVKLFKQFSFD